MNNGTNHNNSGFMGGFIFGALFGGIVVFLFATKKGKKLLKMLINEGGEGIAEIEEFLTEEVFEEKPPVLKQEKVTRETKETPLRASFAEVATKAEQGFAGHAQEITSNPIPRAITRLGTSGRRFFRGKRPL